MSDPMAVLGTIVELFTYLGLIVGAIFLVAGLAVGAAARRRTPHDGVVIAASDHGVSFRWFGDDGGLHEGSDHPEPGRTYAEGDDVTVYASATRPSDGRLDSPRHAGRALRAVGWILLAIGLASVVASIVLLFVE